MVMIEIQRTETVAVKFLKVSANVRYWEDANVNGIEDTNGTMIPCRNGESWEPTIDLDTGRIVDWPTNTLADVHYKVCDEGRYALTDADGKEVCVKDGYVPSIMSPNENGYGDYIIMTIGADGTIANFDNADLDEFTASS